MLREGGRPLRVSDRPVRSEPRLRPRIREAGDPFMNLLTRSSTYNSPMARSLRETDRSTCSKCGTSPGT